MMDIYQKKLVYIRNGIYAALRYNKIMLFTEIWIELEGIMMSETISE